MPFTQKDFASCADVWKEHSGATRACVWLAILRFDYHSLTRQQSGVMINLVKQHCHDGFGACTSGLKWRGGDKYQLIIELLSIVHSSTERCHLDMDPGRLTKHIDQSVLMARPRDDSYTVATSGSEPVCGPLESFDIRRLPYRWLPGLPPPRAGVRELLPPDEALHAQRFEVMHIADYWPGPTWLYHSPGSGVWWEPGRRVVARNLVDAILKFNNMSTVVHHLERVGNGDRRLNRYRAYLQWSVAFGGKNGPSWETILEGARNGDPKFEHFASAGELLGELITGYGAIPEGYDSVLLREQTHFWPRGSTWDVSDDGYAPSMVMPCPHEKRTSASGDGEILHVRTHRVPEMVDLRAQRGNKRTKFGAAWRSGRDIPRELYAHLTADREGQKPCVKGRATKEVCTSCSPTLPTQKLCACATLRKVWRRGRLLNPLSMMTRPEFDAAQARECCLRKENKSGFAW